VAQAHTWQVSVRLSVTYNHNAGAKKRRLARPEPTWPVKLLKIKDRWVSERVGFESSLYERSLMISMNQAQQKL
jgi:hypothetical protein